MNGKIIEHTVNDVIDAIRSCWKVETTCWPNSWDKDDNPALGQEVATALVVKDLLGGFILIEKAIFSDGSTEIALSNILADDIVVDITKVQYPSGTIFTQPKLVINDKQIQSQFLDDKDSLQRYNSLRLSVHIYLNKLKRNR